MKNLAVVSALAFSLAGCNGVTTLTNDINAVTGALSSPAANQAAANLRAGAQAIACSVANVAALVKQIESGVQIPSKYAVAIVRDTNTVYVVSTDACAFFGGQSLGPEVVPANAPAAVVPTKAS